MKIHFTQSLADPSMVDVEIQVSPTSTKRHSEIAFGNAGEAKVFLREMKAWKHAHDDIGVDDGH